MNHRIHEKKWKCVGVCQNKIRPHAIVLDESEEVQTNNVNPCFERIISGAQLQVLNFILLSHSKLCSLIFDLLINRLRVCCFVFPSIVLRLFIFKGRPATRESRLRC